jgi:hypothetical protein
MAETIWFDDPAILFAQDSWSQFIPTKNMTVAESLNAVLRFTIYFSLLLFLSTGKGAYIISIPIMMAFTFGLYKLFPNGSTLESFISSTTSLTGVTKPTPDNPFMNVLINEIVDNPERPPADDVTSKNVRDEIQRSFQQTSDIYMDTSDLFDLSNSMRLFHVNPGSTIPGGDIDKFKNLLKKGQDYPDYSSAAPSRNAKLSSESYVHSKGSMRLPNSTSKPAGVSPSSTSLVK